MAGITTAMLTSFKRDLLAGLHCFTQSRTFTATTINGAFTLTAMSALLGIAVGNPVSGTGISAGAVLASVDSATQTTMSKAATASNAGITVTTVGDIFKMALVKVGPAGTYGAASTNYTDITGNTDEVTGTGYTAGGTALTNVDPSIPSGTTAITNFSPNPSWTSASFSTTGCMIYNTIRRGANATPGVSVHDFGGTQTVASGTFTVVMPTADATNAILRIG